MYAGDARISVSVATIAFTKSGDGTALTVTEQGAYLDGIDGPQAPSSRKEGVTEMLDNLTGYLVFRERGTLTAGNGSRTMVYAIDCEGGGSAA
jgi:hypothetical protein